MRIAGWILYRLLSRIFTSIQFNKSQIDRIKACSDTNRDRNIPVVYLPLHRSHLDYILISFILYMNNIKPPLVAAGDNLMIPFFGNLMRGLGAFFIKRRSETNQNPVYQAIMRSYITENLREGNSLEFFMEGGRTRSGKLVMPKFGLLSIVVDALLQGKHPLISKGKIIQPCIFTTRRHRRCLHCSSLYFIWKAHWRLLHWRATGKSEKIWKL